MHELAGATVRLILADDHTLTRAGLGMLLEEIEGVEVVAQAANGEELIRKAEALEPDIVFTDIAMPGIDGLEAIRRLARSRPKVRCLVVSMHDTVEMVRRACDAGAVGYMMKNASAQELGMAIGHVLRGETYFSPAVSALLLASAEPHPCDLLTDRQLEVLAMVANGKSSKEIADTLRLSPRTVDVHRARIMDRLQVHEVASLTRYAIRNGLVSG
jgi:DNA-binding NarL/FixJ family response regulator